MPPPPRHSASTTSPAARPTWPPSRTRRRRSRCRRRCRGSSYDQYRDIRFKPAKAVWRAANLPFELQLFHPGLYYDQPVRISEVVDGKAREIRFDPEFFDYGKNKVDPQGLRGLGFAGFRVHFPLNNPKYKDEVLVFQGASYFRALGKDQRYGLSARGLAVDTGARVGRGVPALRRVLDRTPRGGRQGTHDLRPARLEARHRRLPVRAAPRRGDRHRGEGAPVPARERDQARPGAAHQHVHVRREPAFAEPRLPARGARLRPAARSRPAPASGSRGRW